MMHSRFYKLTFYSPQLKGLNDKERKEMRLGGKTRGKAKCQFKQPFLLSFMSLPAFVGRRVLAGQNAATTTASI